MHHLPFVLLCLLSEVQHAAKSAMNDPNVKKAAMNAMIGKYTNDPNQKQNNQSFWSAVAKNKDVQNAAVTVAKDKQVQKAAWNQAKKNAPLIKKGAVGAMKMGWKMYNNNNNNKNSKGGY